MSFARQIELVDLSRPQPVSRSPRRKPPPYLPRETLLPTPPPPPTPDLSEPGASAPGSPASGGGAAAAWSPRAPRPDVVCAQLTHALTGSAGGLYGSGAGAGMGMGMGAGAGLYADALSISTSSGASSLASSLSNATTASSALPGLAAETREELFRKVVGRSTVDVDELRRLVWTHGMAAATWARPLVWKLLTGYLPPDRSDWESQLAAKRARYWATVHDLTLDPSARPAEGDHPLNDADSSQWRQFFHDEQLRATIVRDVRRTHPHVRRFDRLRDPLQRLLFVYAKLHRRVGYRQGMNELAAPLLLVFDGDGGGGGLAFGGGAQADVSDVEADAYFCFAAVMAEMGGCFGADAGDDGLARQLRELQALLRIKDPELDRHLEALGVDTRFYGLRWIRLWLAREFALPDALALWDSFLTAELRLPWIRCVCVAMAVRIRARLLRADFAGCMKLLLNYPACDVADLLRIAERLRTSNVVIVRTARP